MNIQVSLWEGRPTQIRLSIWEDSVFWLGIHQSAKRGWAFKMEFHGQAESIAPEDIVRMFEETILMAAERSGSVQAEDAIRAVSQSANPS